MSSVNCTPTPISPSCLPIRTRRAKGNFVRQNHEWVTELTGEMGPDAQQQAYIHLSAYLLAVVNKHLGQRQPGIHWLSSLDEHEINALGQDVVQSCLEKLSKNSHARLAQFTGEGAFTSWAAQVALNIARSELRRVRWHRLQPIDPAITSSLASKTPTPEQALQQGQLSSTIHQCLEQLPPQYRTVLIRCVMHDEKPSDVAKELGRSAQSVYNLVSRAKKRMGELLEMKEVVRGDF